jgi:hypothetical protein
MIGNSIDSTPLTPFPDPPSHSGEEPASDGFPAPVVPPKQPVPDEITTSSEDDLNLLLTQPVPDPFLDEAVSNPSARQSAGLAHPSAEGSAPAPEPGPSGGLPDLAGVRPDIDDGESTSVFSALSSSENELHLPVIFSPSPEAAVPDALPPRRVLAAPTAAAEDREDEQPHGVSWPLLLVASYASAVTLALIWILWTGRSLTHPNSGADSSWEAATSDSTKGGNRRITRSPSAPLPEGHLTALGVAARLGDLEVTPLSVARREIELARLDGSTGETRQVEDVLVLSLRFTNRSRDAVISPLDSSFVRESNSSADDSYIDTASSKRISMFRLAPESEWSIKDQQFPALNPGASGESIVVSEPVQMNQLTGELIWHVKLRTGSYQTDVLGVRFTRQDVSDGGF